MNQPDCPQEKSSRPDFNHGFRKETGPKNVQIKLLQLLSDPPVTSASFREFINKILLGVREVVASEITTIILFDEARESLTQIYSAGEKAENITWRQVIIGEGITGGVVQSGRPLLLTDVKEIKEFESSDNFAVNNLLCVPLKTAGKAVGALHFINKTGSSSFSDDDIKIAEELGDTISIIISNALMILESAKSIKQLRTLIKNTALINSNLVQSNLLNRIMAVTEELMDAEASSIMLINTETNELEFQVARGDKSNELMLITVPLGEGIAGKVAVSGESELVKDAVNDPRIFRAADDFTSFVTKSLLCVPLRTKDKIIGVAQVLNKKGERSYFIRKELELFESMANLAAIAIDNSRLYEELQGSLVGTIRSLVAAIEAKDSLTHGHAERVTMYALAIYNELESDYELDRENIQMCSLLHDIGKIGIDEKILKKPDKLTAEEFQEIMRHPVIGEKIMAPLKQISTDIIKTIRHHHEYYDGSGYPDGLKGEEIPFITRIISVANAFDAITSKNQTFKRGLGFTEAEKEISANSGRQFDPLVVKALKRAIEKGYIHND